MYDPDIMSQQRAAINTANLAPIPQVKNNPFEANMEQGNAAMESAGDEEKPQNKFMHRTKKKASAREIRQRQNRRLRKLLTPKNALMALYELIGNKNCDFKINADAKGFLAEVLVNNVRYEGRGEHIKLLAKNDRNLNFFSIERLFENSSEKCSIREGTSRLDYPKNG